MLWVDSRVHSSQPVVYTPSPSPTTLHQHYCQFRALTRHRSICACVVILTFFLSFLFITSLWQKMLRRRARARVYVIMIIRRSEQLSSMREEPTTEPRSLYVFILGGAEFWYCYILSVILNARIPMVFFYIYTFFYFLYTKIWDNKYALKYLSHFVKPYLGCGGEDF